MGNSVNKVILVGRLGKDPEIRSTSGGKSVASVSLATDESYKNSQGERVKKTEWINLVIWGPSVEAFVQPYLHKGDLIYVEGKLQTRQWESKDGGTRYTTEVNVTDIKGLVTGGQDQPATKSNAGATRSNAAPAQQQNNPPEVDDTDIPF